MSKQTSNLPDIDYQQLFESLPGAYIAFAADDPSFTIVAENAAHAKLANVEGKNIIGKPVFEVFPDVSDKYVQTGESDLLESFRRVIKSGKPDVMPLLHYDIPSASGEFEKRSWRVSHHPITDKSGKVTIVYQSTEDVTAEMIAGQRLEQMQQQLNEALSSGLIGTWLWDIKAGTVIGDKYMAGMFGVPEEDAANGLSLKDFTNHIHEDERTRVNKEITNALKAAKVFESEYRTIRPDGTSRWVIARGRIERDADGKATHFPGVLLDITDRKVIETNLAYLAKAGATLSESLDYKKTLRSIANLTVPAIADWCTVEILESESGLFQVALAHKDPSKIKWAIELRKEQGPPDLSDDSSGLAKVLKTGRPEFYPYISEELIRTIAKNEKQAALLTGLGLSSTIIVPLKVSGKTIGAITLISAEQKRTYTQADLDMAMELAGRASVAITNATLYDEAQKEITARQELEDKLRVSNDELEQRVAERTAELGETNLNLQRSNQELQDFAYVASHDLQEPLRKIQAFGNLLGDEYDDVLGEGKDYLERMRSAAARMSALIEDILSFSRVTTKARGFSPVDLNVVVREVLDDLETRVKDTNAEISVVKLPVIDADAMQMRQLMQNLISNSLKFHKPGAAPIVKITADTEFSQSPRKKVYKIRIEDNGVGFEEKYLDRIFAVFQRLHSRDSYEGTGIGLAVCRKIVERHGGSITATSKPGEGATFIITLPGHHKKGETL